FFQDASNDDRLNGADVINEALGVRGICAGAGEIGLLQPKVGHLVDVGEVDMSVNMLEQPDARERIGVINLIAKPSEVRAALHQVVGDLAGRWPLTGLSEL